MNAFAALTTAGICLLMLAGCGKKDGAPTSTTTTAASGGAAAAAPAANSTCDSRAQNGKCSEFTKSENATADKMGCDMFKGTWSTTPCPTTQAIASCAHDDEIAYYFKGKSISIENVSVDFAKLDCDMISGKLSLLTPAAADKPAAQAVAASDKKPGAAPKVAPTAPVAAPKAKK